jgi:hypothetical protein
MFKKTDKFSDVSFKGNVIFRASEKSRTTFVDTMPIVVDVKISRDACREFSSDSPPRAGEKQRDSWCRIPPEETFYTVVATFDPVLAHL